MKVADRNRTIQMVCIANIFYWDSEKEIPIYYWEE